MHFFHKDYFNSISTHSSAPGACTCVVHEQGKCISYSVASNNFTTGTENNSSALMRGSCMHTPPRSSDEKGGQQHWFSPEQFKIHHFENAKCLDQDMAMVHALRVRWKGFSIENTLFTTATYSLHYLSAVDMMPTLFSAPYRALQNLSCTGDKGGDQTEALWRAHPHL